LAITYRPGVAADGPLLWEICRRTLVDYGRRYQVTIFPDTDDPATLADLWQRLQPLYDHIAATADQSWVAMDGELAVGYARSIVRDGLRQLTEFYVLPEAQGGGIGGELLQRAFPTSGAERRVIQATTNISALARYLRVGVYPRFPIRRFARPAEVVTVATDLTAERADLTPATLAALNDLDRAILGIERAADHHYLAATRELLLYRRAGQTVGYAYLGRVNGPAALLDDADFPAVLAHAERAAAERGEDFDVFVPLINRRAVDYLMSRRCQINALAVQFMSDAPLGRFEHYLSTSPAFIL
jgi:GNAT superfamily N-acetyltransferase